MPIFHQLGHYTFARLVFFKISSRVTEPEPPSLPRDGDGTAARTGRLRLLTVMVYKTKLLKIENYHENTK